MHRQRIRGRHLDDRLDEARHLHHRAPVLVVGLRVRPRVPRNLPVRRRVIVHPPQVVAVHRGERAVERQDLEAVPREVEIADDVGPEQRDDVGALGEVETREDLLRHGRPAEHVAPLEDEHLPPRAREIRGVREAIVSAPDDDDVVRHGGILCRDGARPVRSSSRPPPSDRPSAARLRTTRRHWPGGRPPPPAPSRHGARRRSTRAVLLRIPHPVGPSLP